MTWQEWSEGPYDGAPHPDRSRPEDHDDVHPVAWCERVVSARNWAVKRTFLESISAEVPDVED